MLCTQPKAILHGEALCEWHANGIRTKHQIISEQAVSFGTFHFIFCSHSSKPWYAERGIAHFTLSSGTDQSYKKPYFVWHCRKYESKKLK